MTVSSTDPSSPIRKVPTHIVGFDEILGGGLPGGRTTVVVGTTGSGKTMLGLQFLIEGFRQDGETGIFLSFEETRADLVRTMASLGLEVGEAPGTGVHIMDAGFLPDAVRAGAFDLNGLLAALSALVAQTGASRIVFDAVDVLLELLEDPIAQRGELHRLFQWVRDHDLTAVITAKADGALDSNPVPAQPLLLYLSHCVVILRYHLQDGICGRSIRLLKYRGAGHSLNELPMMIDDNGLSVYGLRPADMSYKVSEERISSGVERLDTMLGGGLYRGTSILVSGSPGTAKTTLGGTFISAACERGEKAVLISLDEAPEQICRNLSTVGMDLMRHVASGALIMRGYRAGSIETEAFLRQVLNDVDSHGATALVIDPISALSDRTQFRGKNDAAARLLDEAKSRGVTVLFTSLVNKDSVEAETSQAAISTIADTWMQLSFKPFGGERNRAITIIKSRGMQHSNQVRELLINKDGLTLADVYVAGGDVLMGTARLEREFQVEIDELGRRQEFARRRIELELLEKRLGMQRQELDAELEARRGEMRILEELEERRVAQRGKSSDAVSAVRHADAVTPDAG